MSPVWSSKSLKKPIAVAESLPSLNSETNVTFSPDGQYILTGIAGMKAGVLAGGSEEERATELAQTGGLGKGSVVLLSSQDLHVVRKIRTSSRSALFEESAPDRLNLHSHLAFLGRPRHLASSDQSGQQQLPSHSRNSTADDTCCDQILTGSADGSIHVLYSPETAIKGVTLAITKTPKARSLDDLGATDSTMHSTIIAPHSLPMFKEDGGAGFAGGRGNKRRREKERHDPQKTLKPSKHLGVAQTDRGIELIFLSCSAARCWTRLRRPYRCSRHSACGAGPAPKRDA